MIDEINKAWNWKEIKAVEIMYVNDFGNIIFKNDNNEYWRICPEELTCEKIAKSESELNKLMSDSEFISDWQMINLVEVAKSKLGTLEEGQKYCLKMPAVIGGEYSELNLGKIDFLKLIGLSGDLGFQIKDIKDGERIRLNVK